MSEILKGLWGKLYAWALPSALAVGATWLFLLPQLGGRIDLPKDNEGQGLIFLALTGALAISLSSLSTHLYRLRFAIILFERIQRGALGLLWIRDIHWRFLSCPFRRVGALRKTSNASPCSRMA
jgi:hypothetical protein